MVLCVLGALMQCTDRSRRLDLVSSSFGSDVHKMLALVAFGEHKLSTHGSFCLHFGPQKAWVDQPDLRRTSVFHKENNGFVCFRDTNAMH